jgi:cysteine desulfuration protein SufE
MTKIESTYKNQLSIQKRIDDLKSEFFKDADWETRYKRVIDMGKSLPEMPEAYKQDKFLVKGCQSQVWLHAERSPDGRVVFYGDSDAMIVRGLVACLIRVYSGAQSDEILSVGPQFLKEIGFEAHLSPSRANGLNSMVKQIYMYATAFQAMSR